MLKTIAFLWQCKPWLVLLVGLFAGLCWSLEATTEYRDTQERDTQEVDLEERLHGILSTQQKAWNRGEIPAFMDAYWNDPKLTFSSGGKTTRGWQATLDRYVSKYPDRGAMGVLTFESLESIQLDSNAALTLGIWKLDRDKPAGGNFSLVWKKIEGQWKIIHDHSSLLADPS